MLVHKKAPGNTRRTNTKETSRHEAADYRKASIVTDSHDNRVIVIIFFLQLVSDFFPSILLGNGILCINERLPSVIL